MSAPEGATCPTVGRVTARRLERANRRGQNGRKKLW